MSETALGILEYHNDLLGLQGGNATERLHLSTAQAGTLHDPATVGGYPLSISEQQISFNYNSGNLILTDDNQLDTCQDIDVEDIPTFGGLLLSDTTLGNNVYLTMESSDVGIAGIKLGDPDGADGGGAILYQNSDVAFGSNFKFSIEGTDVARWYSNRLEFNTKFGFKGGSYFSYIQGVSQTHNITYKWPSAEPSGGVFGGGGPKYPLVASVEGLSNITVDLSWGDQEVQSTSSPTFNVVTATKFIGWGVLPIGCVVAYLKSLTNTPALPDGFVECNGQVLSDAASVYSGVTLPNLNGASAATKRFLRGSATSGSTADVASNIIIYSATGGYLIYAPTVGVPHRLYGTYQYPDYYEVVWVIRIK